jgi:hypothetical protein
MDYSPRLKWQAALQKSTILLRSYMVAEQL